MEPSAGRAVTGRAPPAPPSGPPPAPRMADPPPASPRVAVGGEAEHARSRPTARAAELARLSPGRAAFELAWPGIIEQVIRASGQTVLFALVGHLGAVSTAAVGASAQFLFLLFPVWGALSTGTVALVSRRMGEGRPAAAADAARQSLVLGAIFGIASGIVFALFARQLLLLVGASPEVADAGAPYLALTGGLNVFSTLSIIAAAAMRAAGDTRAPMWLSAAGSAMLIPSSYVLISVVGLGVIGAAYAYTAVNVVFAALAGILLWRGRAGLRLAGGSWTVVPATTRTLLAISLPTVGETVLFSFGLLGLGVLVFRLGTEAYAAHQILIQVESLSFLPCIGFSAAGAALVGQSLGMRDPARAMHVGWAAARMATTWTTAMGVAFAFFPAFFLGAFTSDRGVVTAGVGAMIVLGIAQPAQGLNFTLGGALRGAGDTRYTMWITLIQWFLLRFPLAVLLAFGAGLGLAGVWMAILIDYAVRVTLLGLRFRGGRWQRLRY